MMGIQWRGPHTCYSDTGGLMSVSIVSSTASDHSLFSSTLLHPLGPLPKTHSVASSTACDLSTVPDNPDTNNCLLDLDADCWVRFSLPKLTRLLQLGLPLSCALSATMTMRPQTHAQMQLHTCMLMSYRVQSLDQFDKKDCLHLLLLLCDDADTHPIELVRARNSFICKMVAVESRRSGPTSSP